MPFDAFALDGRDSEGAGFDGGLGAVAEFCVVEVELVEALAIEVGEAGGEGGAGWGEEVGLDGPVFERAERLDLGFALADQAEGHGLDAAGAAAAGELSPQYGGEGEADEVVEGAPRQVGLDEGLVQFAGVGDGVGDRGLGDFVEGDAADGDALEGLLLLKHGADVPADCLAFTIGVGGEVESAGALDGLGDGGDLALAAFVGGPVHREVLLRANAAVLGGEIADMAEAGEDGVAATEVFIDGLGFGRGLDDNDVCH